MSRAGAVVKWVQDRPRWARVALVACLVALLVLCLGGCLSDGSGFVERTTFYRTDGTVERVDETTIHARQLAAGESAIEAAKTNVDYSAQPDGAWKLVFDKSSDSARATASTAFTAAGEAFGEGIAAAIARIGKESSGTGLVPMDLLKIIAGAKLVPK